MEMRGHGVYREMEKNVSRAEIGEWKSEMMLLCLTCNSERDREMESGDWG